VSLSQRYFLLQSNKKPHRFQKQKASFTQNSNIDLLPFIIQTKQASNSI